jgi:beta-glucosidase-like glycosyl hydrolase
MNGLVFDNTDTKTISMLIDIIKKDKEIIKGQLIENKKDKEIIEEQSLEINELKEELQKFKNWNKKSKKNHYQKNKEIYLERSSKHKKQNPELVKEYNRKAYLKRKNKIENDKDIK